MDGQKLMAKTLGRSDVSISKPLEGEVMARTGVRETVVTVKSGGKTVDALVMGDGIRDKARGVMVVQGKGDGAGHVRVKGVERGVIQGFEVSNPRKQRALDRMIRGSVIAKYAVESPGGGVRGLASDSDA